MSTAQNREPPFLDTEPAMIRAAEQARRIAIQTGTPLAIWRDGQVVLIQPDEALSPVAATPPPKSEKT